MTKPVLSVLLGAALALIPAHAGATVITRAFTINASGFDAGAPVDPVKGTFTVTYDTAVSVSNVTSGISATGFNLPFDGPLSFTYDGGNALYIGAGAMGVTSATRDFGINLFDPNTASVLSTSNFIYSVPSLGFFQTFNTRATAVTLPAAAPVPEPATWAMLLVGFGAIGFAMRRKRAPVASAAFA